MENRGQDVQFDHLQIDHRPACMADRKADWQVGFAG